ncbi:MAG: caspase family protein [Planctomycetales bacterium]|nr:caspase family protein [Planctomycetales bacterium]
MSKQLTIVLAALAVFGCGRGGDTTPARGPGAIGVGQVANTNATHPYRESFAIIVGIDDYTDEALPPLKFAKNDAVAIQDILIKEFGYAETSTLLLTDESASRGAIESALTSWAQSHPMTERDSLLFFFAGHGVVDGESEDGYLVGHDSSMDKKSCVSVAWVRAELEKLVCRHKVVILDSCYSGALFHAVTNSSNSPATSAARPSGLAGLAKMLEGEAFMGLSAGRDTPVADGFGADRHSLFTSALLESMRSRANSPSETSAFTFSQLASAVTVRVANSRQGSQVPNWGRLKPGDGDFVFQPTLQRRAQLRFAAADKAVLKSPGVERPIQPRQEFELEQGWRYPLQVTGFKQLEGRVLSPVLSVSTTTTPTNPVIPLEITSGDIDRALAGVSTTKVYFTIDPNQAPKPLALPELLKPVELPRGSVLSPQLPSAEPNPFGEDANPFEDKPANPNEDKSANPFEDKSANPFEDNPTIPVENKSANPLGGIEGDSGGGKDRNPLPQSANPFDEPPKQRDQGEFLQAIELQRQVLADLIEKEVDRAIAKSRELAESDTEEARLLLKQALELVERTPDLGDLAREVLRNQLRDALREVMKRQILAEERRSFLQYQDAVLQERQRILGLAEQTLTLLDDGLLTEAEQSFQSILELAEPAASLDKAGMLQIQEGLRTVSLRFSDAVRRQAASVSASDPLRAHKLVATALRATSLRNCIDFETREKMQAQLAPIVSALNAANNPSRVQCISSDQPLGQDVVVLAALRGEILAILSIAAVKEKGFSGQSTRTPLGPLLSAGQRTELRRRQLWDLGGATITLAIDAIDSGARAEMEVAAAELFDTIKLFALDKAGDSPTLQELRARMTTVLKHVREISGDCLPPRSLSKSMAVLMKDDYISDAAPDIPLDEWLTLLRDVHEIRFKIDRQAFDDAGVDSETPINVEGGVVPLGDKLHEILEPLGLAFLPTSNGVLVTTVEEEEEKCIALRYKVDDIVCDKLPLDLIDEILDRVDITKWEDVGGFGTIEYDPATKELNVFQAWSTHRLLRQYLDDLRS